MIGVVGYDMFGGREEGGLLYPETIGMVCVRLTWMDYIWSFWSIFTAFVWVERKGIH